MTIEENRARLLADALSGGPGLDGYAYQADVHCVSCARAIIAEIVASYPACSITDTSEIPCSSDEIPQPIFFGEHEIAQHCAECGEYLYGG